MWNGWFLEQFYKPIYFLSIFYIGESFTVIYPNPWKLYSWLDLVEVLSEHFNTNQFNRALNTHTHNILVVVLTPFLPQTERPLERPSIRSEQGSKLDINSDGKRTPYLNWETLKNAIPPVKLEMILIKKEGRLWCLHKPMSSHK